MEIDVTTKKLLLVLHRYIPYTRQGVSINELHKLLYFIKIEEEFGGVETPDITKPKFGAYGPECNAETFYRKAAPYMHVNGEPDLRTPWASIPMLTKTSVIEDLEENEEIWDTAKAVTDTIEGFYGAWRLELLSTVHWFTVDSFLDFDKGYIWGRIMNCEEIRKNRAPSHDEIEEAYGRLIERGLV